MGSGSRKRQSQSSQKPFNDISLKQTKMARGENGEMVLKEHEETLKEVHGLLLNSMRTTKKLRRKYKQMKKEMEYLKTPVISDDDF